MNITRMATILSQKKTHHIIYTTSTKESKFAMLNLESKAHNKNDYYPKPETHQHIMKSDHRKNAQNSTPDIQESSFKTHIIYLQKSSLFMEFII